MLELTLFGLRLRFSLLFACFSALLCVFSGEELAAYAAAICVHEGGHLFAMTLLREKPQAITFRLGRIEIARSAAFPATGDAAVFAAGASANLAAAAASYSASPAFARINLFMAAFNLVPAAGFDGGRLLELLLIHILPNAGGVDRARKHVSAASGFALLTLAALGFLNSRGSPALLAVSAYALASTLFNM